MILQSLQKLAIREGLTENPDYEVREVHWVINLKPDGRFISLDSLLQGQEGQETKKTKAKKVKPRGVATLVPRPFPGASRVGTAPDAGFLVDNASFVCGLDLTKEKKYATREGELERRQSDFRSLVESAEKTTRDEGLCAVLSFLSKPNEIVRAQAVVKERADSGELQSNHLIVFRLDRDSMPYVHNRSRVVEYWGSLRAKLELSSGYRQCLITGERGVPIDKHPPIKGVPGGTRSGVSIVSFNSGAFESYGFKRNDNAPVSRGAAEQYTTALNRLLNAGWPDPHDNAVKLPEQRVLLSEDTVAVFWTDEPSPVPSAIAPAIGQGDPEAANALGVALEVDESYEELTEEEEPLPSVEPLKVAHEAPWKGLKPEQLMKPGVFRLLILSGGQGRATVRSFQTSSVRHTVNAIQRWFEDIRLSSMRGKPALGRLLRSLAVRGEIKNMHPNLASEVFLAILSDRPLPLLVLENCMRRCRSEPDKRQIRGKSMQGLKATPERIALIKAWLNRALRSRARSPGLLPREITFKEVKPTMNEEEHNKGYLLGRMFACIERMQELALGDVGASVTDRYFGSACATPQVAFPRLLKNELHHYRKAKEGQRGGYARSVHFQIDRLSKWLVGEANGMGEGEAIDSFLRRIAGRPLAGFPTFLPLPEQGLFALGYHQQRAEFFKRRKEEPESEENLAEQK